MKISAALTKHIFFLFSWMKYYKVDEPELFIYKIEELKVMLIDNLKY